MNSIYNSSGQRVGEYDGSTVYLDRRTAAKLEGNRVLSSSGSFLGTLEGQRVYRRGTSFVGTCEEAGSIRGLLKLGLENRGEIVHLMEQRHCFSDNSYFPDS